MSEENSKRHPAGRTEPELDSSPAATVEQQEGAEEHSDPLAASERHALAPPGPEPDQLRSVSVSGSDRKHVAESQPLTQRSAGRSVPDGEDARVGTILADRYRVLSLLGVGGMGSVYRGEHVHMRNAVAIKVLHPELVIVPEICARFEREAIAAARIDDPHVVNATDFGRLPDGSFYLVLEYVEGSDLATLLQGGPLDPTRALGIARQIVAALATAHAAGVIHRDLKPENVMVLERPDQPDFVKVLDFGIAKVTLEDRPSLDPYGQVLTQLGSVFGTPQYMAPEQASGSAVDHRADLYTVGVILYEMLSGGPPFDDEDVAELLRAQMCEAPAPLPADVNQSLAELVMTQLSKEPEQRSQTAEELLAWMDAVLEECLVPAPEPGMTSAALDGSSPGLVATPAPGEAGAPAPADIARRPPTRWAYFGLAGLLLGIAAVGGGALVWFAARPEASPVASTVPTPPHPASSPSARRGPPLDEQLLVRAASGDSKAVRAIEKRPKTQRTTAQWVALARGRMQLGQRKAALQAYVAALEADPSLSRDRTLLGHVRIAANHDDTAEEALRIAALRLGSDGADLLYHVWVSTKAKTSTTQLAKQLVYGADVRSKASPALAVALELRESESCDEIKQLLPRATLHGDIRAYRVLKPLTLRHGCGPKKREDCYRCLREGSVLQDAIAAGRARPEPTFVVH